MSQRINHRPRCCSRCRRSINRLHTHEVCAKIPEDVILDIARKITILGSKRSHSLDDPYIKVAILRHPARSLSYDVSVDFLSQSSRIRLKWDSDVGHKPLRFQGFASSTIRRW